MALVLSSPADLVNDALVRIGYRSLIGNLYDGSEAAQKCLAIYGQTRDDLLEQNDWDFASRTVALTLTKAAPPNGYFPPTTWNPNDYPAIPWLYEYAWNDDMLKVRAVKPPPLFPVNIQPTPNLFTVSNDPGTVLVGTRKVILTNIADAICVYTGQVTNPLEWNAVFAEALSAALGKNLATGLTGIEVANRATGDAAQTQAVAELERG